MRIVIVFLTLVLASATTLAQQSVPPPPQPAVEAGANAEVLKLLRAGVSERAILHIISASPGKFDTSADALAALKQAGASEAELSAIAAQGAAPTTPPVAGAPATSGPSLAETMQFIQDKVNEQGKITSIESYNRVDGGESPSTSKYSKESRVIAVDPAGGLSLQEQEFIEDSSGTSTWRVYFKDVKKLEVLNSTDLMNRIIQRAGHPEIVVQDDPPIYELYIHLAAGKTMQRHSQTIIGGKHSKTTESDDNIGEFVLHFRDEEMANRVAKAMIHAIELCGGSSKPEPF